MIKYLQSVNSDPVGVGNMIRAKYNSYWNKTKWEDVYKKAKIQIQTHVTYEYNGGTK